MSKIGIFDSGFGGLTVLSGIRKALPQYDYLYLGDSARAPYGSRSQEIIYEFTKQAVDFLFKKGCEIIVLACNTASSEALRKIQQEYLLTHYPKKRVLGVVIPACEAAVEKGYKKVGIMATTSTIQSGSYEREIKKLNKDIVVVGQSCPLLVPIIESGDISFDLLPIVLKDYIKNFLDVEAIILGCTHYEIIEKKIADSVNNIPVISQSAIVADKFKDYLRRHKEIENKLSRNESIKYYSTDITDKFKRFGEKIVGEKLEVEKVELI